MHRTCGTVDRVSEYDVFSRFYDAVMDDPGPRADRVVEWIQRYRPHTTSLLELGCGTGSILAETLGRLGIGSLTLIDADRLDETNLNRWQGAEPWMVGKSKAHLLARRLKRMCPRLRIQALDRSVFDPGEIRNPFRQLGLAMHTTAR